VSTNRWQKPNITVNSQEMRNILVLLLVIIFQNLSAQQELPIIRA